jgi:spectinomycin phosphotransferase
LLATHAAGVVGLLETFDGLATRVATRNRDLVITHGEPHSGNLMRVAGKPVLVDWDTVALAPPERDLWMVATNTGEELALYTDATRRDIDPAALALYRLRWTLDDIAIYVELLRSPHAVTTDTEHAVLSLTRALEEADRWAGARAGRSWPSSVASLFRESTT